jgi:hypothetical protein
MTHFEQIKKMLDSTPPMENYYRVVDSISLDPPVRFIVLGGAAAPDAEEVVFAFNSDGSLYNIHLNKDTDERMAQALAASIAKTVEKYPNGSAS